MRRQQFWFAALLLLLGVFYAVGYAPQSHVWNNDPTLLQQVTPPLRKLLALHLLVLGGLGLVGLWMLARPWRGQTWAALLLLGGGGLLISRLLPSYLATDYYTIWKYQFKTEEYYEPTPPVLNTSVVTLLLHDLGNPAESIKIRSCIALTLGEARLEAGYPALIAIVNNPRQNPYLRFHCLKSLRRLRPRQFAAILHAVPADSAAMLYRQYE